MATALQGFRLQARSCQRLRIAKSIERRRAFSTVTALRAGDSSGNGNKRNSGIRKDISDDSNEDFDEDDRLDQEVSETLSKHDNPDRVPIGPVINQKDLPRPYIPPINKNSPMWDTRPEKHEKYLEKLKTVGKVFYDPELQEAVEEELIERPREAGINNLYDPPMKRKKKLKETFLNMGDPEPFEDENFDFEGDTHEEMTSMGHGELEQHREMRHYARLAAWEMPLLSSMWKFGEAGKIANRDTEFAKPFVPPTADMVLRFRYTTYLGEQHPAEKKVVVEFTTRDMPNLTAVQRKKLVNLAGVRYNPEKDLVKMSCEMFPSQAQNKRYLGDLVDQMLREARVRLLPKPSEIKLIVPPGSQRYFRRCACRHETSQSQAKATIP